MRMAGVHGEGAPPVRGIDAVIARVRLGVSELLAIATLHNFFAAGAVAGAAHVRGRRAAPTPTASRHGYEGFTAWGDRWGTQLGTCGGQLGGRSWVDFKLLPCGLLG